MSILLALSLSLVSQVNPGGVSGVYKLATSSFLPTIPNEIHSAASMHESGILLDQNGHVCIASDNRLLLSPLDQALAQPTALAVLRAFAAKKLTATQANAQLKDALNVYLKPRGMTASSVSLAATSSPLSDFEMWAKDQAYSLYEY